MTRTPYALQRMAYTMALYQWLYLLQTVVFMALIKPFSPLDVNLEEVELSLHETTLKQFSLDLLPN